MTLRPIIVLAALAGPTLIGILVAHHLVSIPPECPDLDMVFCRGPMPGVEHHPHYARATWSAAGGFALGVALALLALAALPAPAATPPARDE